jgi:glucose-6-phosphate 1-dehydrogenase
MTDTFVAARLWIDDVNWRHIPFYIRTGKRMREKSTRIAIEFKDAIKEAYDNGAQTNAPNLLTIEINPHEKITLQLNNKNPMRNGQLEPVNLELAIAATPMKEAYELLLHDAMRGNATFFAHWEEVELAWKWVQPVLEAFEKICCPFIFIHQVHMVPKRPCVANLVAIPRSIIITGKPNSIYTIYLYRGDLTHESIYYS